MHQLPQKRMTKTMIVSLVSEAKMHQQSPLPPNERVSKTISLHNSLTSMKLNDKNCSLEFGQCVQVHYNDSDNSPWFRMIRAICLDNDNDPQGGCNFVSFETEHQSDNRTNSGVEFLQPLMLPDN